MQQQVVAQQVLIMADLESIGPYGPKFPAQKPQQQFTIANRCPAASAVGRPAAYRSHGSRRRCRKSPPTQMRSGATRNGEATQPPHSNRGHPERRNPSRKGRNRPAQTDSTLPQEHDIFPDIHLHSFVTGLSNSTHLLDGRENAVLTNTS